MKTSGNNHTYVHQTTGGNYKNQGTNTVNIFISFCFILSLALYISLYPLLYSKNLVDTNVAWCHKTNINTHMQDTHQQDKLLEVNSLNQQLSLTYQNMELRKPPDGNHSFVNMPAFLQIKQVRDRNKNRIIIGHLNINSVRNEFVELESLTSGNIDIICISETKLDSSFPVMQFTREGYSKPYRRDNTDKSGGLLIFVKEGIMSKPLKTKFTRISYSN